MNTWLLVSCQDKGISKFDGMGTDLQINNYGKDKQPLLDRKTAEKLADAFYGWSWI